jgi:hypothetical protein
MRTTGHNKLKDIQVKNAPAKGVLSDGGGLYVRNRLYVFRYTSPITGKERDLSLGPLHALKLKAARERAAEFRALIASNVDPHHHVAEELEAKKAEAAKAVTFGAVAAKWMDEKLPERKGLKNQRAVRAIIETHTASLSKVVMTAVTGALIADCVKPLKDRPAQRDNVVSLIHQIFDWAMAAELIPEALNPARRSKLGKLLPKRAEPVQHNRFVETKDLPAFMVRLAATPGNLARCLEFIIHAGLRQNDGIG